MGSGQEGDSQGKQEMRSLSRFALLGVAIFWSAAEIVAEDKVPLAVSLRPQMLAIAPTAKIEFACELTNSSDKPIAVDWEKPWVTMFPRQINVAMSDGSISRKVDLAAGESKSLPVVLQLGEDLPALDAGDYDLVFNVSLDAAERRRHLRESLPLTIVARDGEKPAVTAESLAAAAREFAKAEGDADKLKVESYLIRRNGKGWAVEFSLRGPQRFGSLTISLDATGHRAHTLPIP
jgi:hypothetical protein